MVVCNHCGDDIALYICEDCYADNEESFMCENCAIYHAEESNAGNKTNIVELTTSKYPEIRKLAND